MKRFDRLERVETHGRWLALFVIVTLLLSACTSAGSVAARRGESGVELLIGTCPEQQLQELKVSHFDESGWETVWEIERDTSGNLPSHLTIGEAPAGFETLTPLSSPIDESKRYSVEAFGDGSYYVGGFTPEELTEDGWQDNSRVFEDETAFLLEADDYCGTEYLEFDDRVGRFLWVAIPFTFVVAVIWLVAKGVVAVGRSAMRARRRDS